MKSLQVLGCDDCSVVNLLSMRLFLSMCLVQQRLSKEKHVRCNASFQKVGTRGVGLGQILRSCSWSNDKGPEVTSNCESR